MKFCGIDPGVHGAMSLIWTDETLGILGYESYHFDKMSESEVAARMKLLSLNTAEGEPLAVVVIEKQGTRPTDARKNVARLHHQWGMLRGFLLAYHIPFEDISAASWQKTFHLLMPKGTSHTVKKNKHKEVAQRLFPEAKIIHSNADAFLLAEHARRQYQRGVACG